MAGTPDWEVGIVKGATWGTAVPVAALSGLKIESESLGEGIPEPIKDENVGDALTGGTYQGNIGVEGALVCPMRFLGPTSGFMMALLMGESGNEARALSTPDQIEAAIAFKHFMYFLPSNTGKFATVVIDKSLGADKYYEYPSAKITGVELSHNNGKLQGSFNLLATECERASSVNQAAAIAAITHSTTGLLALFNHLTLSISAVTGSEGNFDGADEILVSDAKFTLNRNLSGDHLSGSSAGMIDEPEISGFPEASLEFTIPDYSTGADALVLAAQTVNAGRIPTTYKATLTWQGPLIGASATNRYEIGIDIPAMTISSAPTNAGSPGAKVPVTVGFDVLTPQADALANGTDWAWVTAGSLPFRFTIQNSISTAI